MPCERVHTTEMGSDWTHINIPILHYADFIDDIHDWVVTGLESWGRYASKGGWDSNDNQVVNFWFEHDACAMDFKLRFG